MAVMAEQLLVRWALPCGTCSLLVQDVVALQAEGGSALTYMQRASEAVAPWLTLHEGCLALAVVGSVPTLLAALGSPVPSP
jgi:hypothetical protein